MNFFLAIRMIFENAIGFLGANGNDAESIIGIRCPFKSVKHSRMILILLYMFYALLKLIALYPKKKNQKEKKFKKTQANVKIYKSILSKSF